MTARRVALTAAFVLLTPFVCAALILAGVVLADFAGLLVP